VTAPAAAIPAAALTGLREEFGGQLVLPADDGYDAARHVWNGAIERRPALIARCAGPSDVARAVRFARDQGLPATIRGGGHGVGGHAVSDGGLVIDLSGLTSVTVDPQAGTATAAGGATWEDFDAAAARHGLATTGGQISTTGVAGLALGGGLGWLMRAFGASVDNLLSADVIMADGSHLSASESEHPDLFWALRGGGGNFGIATALTFRLHEIGQVLGGAIFWPVAQAVPVMNFYAELTAAAADEVSLMTYFVPRLNAPFIPPELRDEPMVAIAVCCHDQRQWDAVISALKAFGTPAGDSLAPMSYPQLQSLYDVTAPFGMKAYWRSAYLTGLPDPAVQTIREFAAAASSSLSQILITHLGGTLRHAPTAGTSFGHRDAVHVLEIIAKWNDGPAEPHAQWADEFLAAMRPFSTGGVYVNFLGDEGRARIESAYEPGSLARLAQLKARYDPDNFFRANQNILPAAPLQ
jgi:FAD/FMN-containing dehydrogenase